MKFIADFHIHSRFSRATAKNLDFENLYIAAQLKGITVIGTGDFTHPGWFAEIREKLVPAEQGLFKLRDDISKNCDQEVPQSCRGKVRFLLVSEISNIYKKNNKTRKNHNLVFLPDLYLAENLISKLDKIGNIKSDGRPILGLDAKDLLEILLETSDQAFLIPAHIWTPWFSLLGSKSGFDSIEECFEDLTPNIFAVETGLSSDPAMNWRVSDLDGLTLVSNSDAHSPLKLGREANIFDTELSYDTIKSAIKTGDPEQFLGTLEFYPEEGKYHLDGHRKCNVCLWPEMTRKKDGICPVCQKPLTLGVLNRVEELSDRPEGEKPEKHHPFINIIPLIEILSEVLKAGPGTKKVMRYYRTLLDKLGPEFIILNDLEKETINSSGGPLLGEAISRMRRNEIALLPGYDGEFGKIKIFDPQERKNILGQKSLFVPTLSESVLQNKKHQGQKKKYKRDPDMPHKTDRPLEEAKKSQHDTKELNKKQRQAVRHERGPLMIVAGPGTGKTLTLTHRIASLMADKGIAPQNILAVTFTNKAAREMEDRLKRIIGETKTLPFIGTFHGFCYKLLNDHKETSIKIIDEEDRQSLISDAIKIVEQSDNKVTIKKKSLLDWTISAKQRLLEPNECLDEEDVAEKHIYSKIYSSYQKLLSIQDLYDYEDLVFKIVRLFETDEQFATRYRDIFKFVFVDEYQDLNHGQYRLINAIAPPGETGRDICVIGDPDQSIYGFRGSNVKYFNRFIKDYPDAKVVKLTRNYRSTQTILDASYHVVNAQEGDATRPRIYSQPGGVKTISVIEAGSEKAEAVAVGRSIEHLIGGIGFHSLDFGNVDNQHQHAHQSFSDFAVLFRTADQKRIFSEVFDEAGIPYQIVSRKHVFKTKGVLELISLLKILEGSGSYADFERIINLTKTRINKQSLQIFKNWCYKNRFTISSAMENARRFPISGMSKQRQNRLCEFLDELLSLKKKTAGLKIDQKLIFLVEYTKLAEQIQSNPKTEEAINRLIEMSRTFDHNIFDFFSMAALQSDTDTYTTGVEKVAFLTMHAAKGLEFPVVFVVGCENGYIPFKPFDNDPTDLDEERRLFFVAMTRAKERLYLTCAKKRKIYGKTEQRTLSPFVGEIEERLRTHEEHGLGKKKKDVHTQMKLF
jgi:uncharacterized protein (TIGR00375 family)